MAAARQAHRRMPACGGRKAWNSITFRQRCAIVPVPESASSCAARARASPRRLADARSGACCRAAPAAFPAPHRPGRRCARRPGRPQIRFQPKPATPLDPDGPLTGERSTALTQAQITPLNGRNNNERQLLTSPRHSWTRPPAILIGRDDATPASREAFGGARGLRRRGLLLHRGP